VGVGVAVSTRGLTFCTAETYEMTCVKNDLRIKNIFIVAAPL
jgi:uncharacterized protein YaiE (UPF0345 family)